MLADQPLCRDSKHRSAVTPAQLNEALVALPHWHCIQSSEPKLERAYRFVDFSHALAFANTVGQIAESADHHPVLTIAWGNVTVQWWTHEIHNIHQNDIRLAAQTDRAYNAMPPASKPHSTAGEAQ